MSAEGTKVRRTSRRVRLLQVACLCASITAACGERGTWMGHVRWSPDGLRAAVLAQDGLYLTDASGRLSDLSI